MKTMLIIGGSDAGISAALRIRELDHQADVTVIVADSYPNFSICGLPFYLSGEVTDWHNLAHRSAEEIEKAGIRLLLNHKALKIEPHNKQVYVQFQGKTRQIGYDKLLISTGAESAVPPINGVDSPGVFFLRWMDDSFAVNRFMEQTNPRRAVVVGGGYIGLEMADAMRHRKIEVTLIEFAPNVLTTLDSDLGRLINDELTSKGVQVITGQSVNRIFRNQGTLIVQTERGEELETDMVLVATGASPSTALAQTAGVGLGEGRAINVNRSMATQIQDIWAAGDCVQTWHRILKQFVYMPLGTTAHKQGRVAGENMLSGNCEFHGSLGTQAVKVFDKVAARTGLRDKEAIEAGYEPFTAKLTVWDHKAYYPGAKSLHIRITGDKRTGLLLGAQMVGHRESEVAKRIDIFAAALFNEMNVKEMIDLDLSYTPPISSPWDPVQMAAMKWCEWDENSLSVVKKGDTADHE